MTRRALSGAQRQLLEDAYVLGGQLSVPGGRRRTACRLAELGYGTVHGPGGRASPSTFTLNAFGAVAARHFRKTLP